MDKTHYIGVDIAKDKFDVAVYSNNNNKYRHAVFNNTPEGFSRFMAWAKAIPQQLHCLMEATNVYWEDLAFFLYEKGVRVSVINPKQIKGYANSHNLRNKTDKIDAKLIARYCAKEQPVLWQPPAPAYRELLLMLRQLEHLKSHRQKEATRVGMLRHAYAMESTRRMIACLDAEIKAVQAHIAQHIACDAQLKHHARLLQSIPGVGEITMQWLLAYLMDGTRFKRGKHAACYAGLTPMEYQSGKTVLKEARISKIGHSEIRKALYMPAMVYAFGRMREGVYAPFVQRLLKGNGKEAGKPKMVVIVALMRKLLCIAQGVLKSQKPFDPSMHQI